MEQCIFCNGKLEQNKIIKYNYWTIYLNDNQYYFGRIYVALNRHGPENTLSLNEDEWHELKSVLDKITRILSRSFEVDLFSYLVLQNKDRNHFHVHLIPRYNREIRFNDEIFKDENWGKAPIPTPEKKIKKDTLTKLKKMIFEALS